jgi:hypothetical protein
VEEPLADVVQEVMLEIFGAPDRDRYQTERIGRSGWAARFLEGDR